MDSKIYKKNPIPDYERLFQEAEDRERRKQSNAIPKMLLKQNAFAIFISSILYIIIPRLWFTAWVMK